MSEGLLRPFSPFQRNRYRSVSACVITPSSREAACSAYSSHEPSEVAPPGTTFVLNGRGSGALKAGNSPTDIIGRALCPPIRPAAVSPENQMILSLLKDASPQYSIYGAQQFIKLSQNTC